MTVQSSDVASATRGQEATFTVTVTNPTSHEVKGITFREQGDLTGSLVLSVRCTAHGGASCPDTSQIEELSWTAPSMPAGSSLTFEVVVAVQYMAGQTIDNDFWVLVKGRTGPSSATGHGTVVADARTGDYQVYAASGLRQGARLDFMAGSWAWETGSSQTFPMLRDDANSYPLSAGGRFDTSADFVVGLQDMGGGLEPFVAAHRFALTVAELNGASFNVLGSEVAASRQSRLFAAWVGGGVLTLCADPVLYAQADCPGASQHHYALSVSGITFTGTDATHGETLSFQVAKSGTSLYFLRAGTGPDFHGLQLGIPVNAGPPDSAYYFAATTRSDEGWISLTPTGYLAQWDGGLIPDDQISLAAVPGANSGLLRGRRLSDRATMFLAAENAFGVAIGAPGGAADGELQLLVLPSL